MNQGKIFRAEDCGVYAPMWPIHGWLLAMKHLKPHQSEHPSIQCTAFAKRTMVACRRIFPSLSSPYPILTRQPLPSNHFLTRINCLSVSMSKYFALRNSPAFHFFSFSFHFLFGLNSSNFHNWSCTCLANYSQLPYSRAKRAGFK